jgi:hypothetical protein
MGGSGGGDFFVHRKPEEVKIDLRKEEDRTLNQEFDASVAEHLGRFLGDANRRDTPGINAAVDEIKEALSAEVERTFDSIFGGSMRKRTYVDGISDIDILMVLKDAKLKSSSPQQVLGYFEEMARRELVGWEVSRGKLAISLRKGDPEIQVLPAVRDEASTRIPSASGDQWSKINPEGFFRKLTKVNSQFGGKVVPVIKLAKIINAEQPPALQLSGYHLESMAIEAFKGYSGPVNPKAMLEHFFSAAPKLVLSPVKDSTQQSVHVDGYLGAANSTARKEVSAALDRIHRRMKNADALRSEEQWLEPFGEE